MCQDCSLCNTTWRRLRCNSYTYFLLISTSYFLLIGKSSSWCLLLLSAKDEWFLLSLLALVSMCWSCTSGDVSSVKAKVHFQVQ